jgi:hypothetical protein
MTELMGKISIVIILALTITNAIAQSSNAPLNPDYYDLLNRYEIRSGSFAEQFQMNTMPYRRDAIGQFLDSIKDSNAIVSGVDEFNLQYLMDDNWEHSDTDGASRKPFLKYLYRTKADFYKVETEDFLLRINPVFHFLGGFESESDVTPFINTRGIQLHGMIDGKVGFYSYLGENQANNPYYVRNWTRKYSVVPHEGFWKNFKDDGVDYFHARGYVSWAATKHINMQFGYDRFKIGPGFRSMLMSDFGPPYTFLKIQTRVWRINYTNYFTARTADRNNASGTTPDNPYPVKYVTSHHLSINITKNFNVGFFESIAYGSNGFDVAYLNPIIFYRAIEQQNGSADNALVGADMNWIITPGLLFYGQFLLDEFKLSEIRASDGWWANKFSTQAGLKYINVFGIKNLDMQLEWNLARPYTYTHRNIYNNYAHYRQPIAHDLGANFNEIIAGFRYQPVDRLQLSGKFIFANYGEDTLSSNWGKNILLNYDTREQDYGNTIGQGVSTDLMYIDLTASWMLKHNLFIDVKQIFRELKSEQPSLSESTSYTSIGLRLNIRPRLHEF